MYRKQMVFQRIVCFMAVIAAALTFAYSLGLVTDLYDGLYWTNNKVKGAEIFYDIQQFNKQLTYVGIGLLLLSAGLFLTQTHARRKYYIGNYVSSGIFAIGSVAAAIWSWKGILGAGGYKYQFLNNVDFAALAKRAAKYKQTYIESTFWFDLQYLLSGLLIITALLLLINLFLKITVMRSENALIAGGAGNGISHIQNPEKMKRGETGECQR